MKNLLKIRIFKQLFAALLLCFIGCSSVFANELDELKSLIHSEQYQKAYQLADSIKFEYEGLEEFDTLYATAALETGHPDIAVFAYERVIAVNPDNQYARLELARAYYMKGEFEKSKALFNSVLNKEPPQSVQDNINQFMVKIDQFISTSTFQTSAFFDFSVGYDNNINSASDETKLSLGNLSFNLNNQKISAPYAKATAGGSYLKRLNKFDSIFIGGQLQKRDNIDNTLDTDDVSLRAGYLYINDNKRISVPVSYQKLSLDGKDYRDLLSVSGEFTSFVNNYEYSSYLAQYGIITYPNLPSSNLSFVNLGYIDNSLTADKENQLNLSYFIGTELPELSGNETKMRNYLGAALVYSDKSEVGLNTGMNAYIYLHKAKNQTFGKIRQDILLNAHLGYSWVVSDLWKIHSKVGYSYNSSNINIYSYNRITAEIGVRADF